MDMDIAISQTHAVDFRVELRIVMQENIGMKDWLTLETSLRNRFDQLLNMSIFIRDNMEVSHKDRSPLVRQHDGLISRST